MSVIIFFDSKIACLSPYSDPWATSITFIILLFIDGDNVSLFTKSILRLADPAIIYPWISSFKNSNTLLDY